MGQPPRHGHGGWSNHPTRLGTGVSALSPKTPVEAVGIEERNVGVIRAKSIDAFLTQLPNPSYNHFTRHESVLWDPTQFGWAGAVVQTFEYTVPKSMVSILMDVQFFAVVPGAGFAAIPEMLNEAGVYGQMYFQVLVNGITPLELEGEYANITGAFTTQAVGRINGWPFLLRDVGEECPCFAVYAGSGAKITGRFITTSNQTFPITSIGTRINGFTVAENVFSTIWERGV